MILSTISAEAAQTYAPWALGVLALGYFLWAFVLSPESSYKSHRLGESRLFSFFAGRKSIRWYIDEIVEMGYLQVGGGDQIDPTPYILTTFRSTSVWESHLSSIGGGRTPCSCPLHFWMTCVKPTLTV